VDLALGDDAALDAAVPAALTRVVAAFDFDTILNELHHIWGSDAPGGRARLGEEKEKARHLLAQGKGIINTAKACGLGTSTVHNLKKEMAAA
jgi:hypothetical protein